MPASVLEVAQAAATAAAPILKRYFDQGVAMRSKEAFNLVSDADVEAEHAIAAVIRKAFPQHAILGEEAHSAADLDADHLWVIDPLDGTTNFAHRIPHVAISIAYFERGQPLVGVIHNPIRGDWYTAEKGAGAFENGRRVAVSTSARLEDALIGMGFYYDRGEQVEGTLRSIGELLHRNIHCVRRFGCASLDLVMTGTGLFDAYFEFALAPWDFAAGWLFVEEAGGRVTTCSGEPLAVKKSSILASNGHLHELIHQIVAPNLPQA